MNNRAYLHGEAFIHASKIPDGARKVKADGKFKIIAPSETSGNHHIIDCPEGVEFYEKDGALYMKNDVETEVRCVITERHDNITLPSGEWEIGIQQEYDPFEARSRNVSD